MVWCCRPITPIIQETKVGEVPVQGQPGNFARSSQDKIKNRAQG